MTRNPLEVDETIQRSESGCKKKRCIHYIKFNE